MLTSFGHRKVSLAGVVLATIGLLLPALYIQISTAPSIVVLYLTIGILTGLGFGLMYLPAMDIVDHFFSRRLGLAMGLACSGSGFGQFVLAPLLHLATDHLGLTGTLYCLSATVAVAVFFVLLYRFTSFILISIDDKSAKCNQFDETPRLPSNHRELSGRMQGTFMGINNLACQVVNLNFCLVNNTCLAVLPKVEQGKESGENTREEAEETNAAKKKVLFSKILKSYISVLSSPAMLLFLLMHFLLDLGISSFFAFSPDRAIQFGGLTKGESSLLLSIIGVSNCLGRIVFGRLLDK